MSSFSTANKINILFKNTFIYGISSSLQSLLVFIFLPILTSYFTPEVFGVYSLLLLISSLSGAIFYFGASSGLGRFYFEIDLDLYKRKIITTSILITLCGASMLIIIGCLFSKFISLWLFQTENHSLAVLLALTGTAFSFLMNIMLLILRYENKAYAHFLVLVFNFFTNLCITFILLTKFKYGILSPFFGLLFSNAICFLFLISRYRNLLTKNLELTHFKIILNFGIQSSVAGLLYYLLDWVDRIIIKDLLDLSQVGVYSLGYRLGSIINVILIVPFSLIWAPVRLRNAKSEDNYSFTTKIISYYTFVGVMILVTSMLFGAELLDLFFENSDYLLAFKIFPIIMTATFFYGYQNIVDFGIYINNKVYYYALVMMMAIIFNIIFNYLLIPNYGVISAAYVTLLTYLISSTTIYFVSNRLYRIKIEKNRVFLLLLEIPIIYILVNYFEISILVKFIIIVSNVILPYKLWLNQNERKEIRLFFKKPFRV